MDIDQPAQVLSGNLGARSSEIWKIFRERQRVCLRGSGLSTSQLGSIHYFRYVSSAVVHVHVLRSGGGRAGLRGQTEPILWRTSASTKLTGNGAPRGSPAPIGKPEGREGRKKRSRAALPVRASLTLGLPAISLKLPVFEYFYPPPPTPTSGGCLLPSSTEI